MRIRNRLKNKEDEAQREESNLWRHSMVVDGRKWYSWKICIKHWKGAVPAYP
jgi:hypothetical protein